MRSRDTSPCLTPGGKSGQPNFTRDVLQTDTRNVLRTDHSDLKPNGSLFETIPDQMSDFDALMKSNTVDQTNLNQMPAKARNDFFNFDDISQISLHS